MTLEALPPTNTIGAIATSIGMEVWAWDLMIAVLRALAVIGGSIGVALGLHPRRAYAVTVMQSSAAPSQRRGQLNKRPRIKTAMWAIAPPTSAMDGREHASQFLLTALQPDPAGVTSLRQLYSMYPRWCREQGTDPMPPAELGQHLLTIFDTIGLTLEVADRDAIIRGAALST
jgi:hypothetical protein